MFNSLPWRVCCGFKIQAWNRSARASVRFIEPRNSSSSLPLWISILLFSLSSRIHFHTVQIYLFFMIYSVFHRLLFCRTFTLLQFTGERCNSRPNLCSIVPLLFCSTTCLPLSLFIHDDLSCYLRDGKSVICRIVLSGLISDGPWWSVSC
jgi:hypothetical protein